MVTGRLNEIEGAVYNTIGLNDCPAEQLETLDPEQLNEEFRANECYPELSPLFHDGRERPSRAWRSSLV
jgi:hypothetical protein